jgi:hypothetical protein
MLSLILGSLFLTIRDNNLSIFFGTISYFSIQTDILITIWLTISLIFFKKKRKPPFLNHAVNGGITVYATFTFLVFTLFLQPLQNEIIIDINHYFIPVYFIIHWFYGKSKNRYKQSYALYWFIYPSIYLVYIFIRGILTGTFPYPFLDLNIMSPVSYILSNIFILALLYVLGRVFIFINQKRYDKQKEKKTD